MTSRLTVVGYIMKNADDVLRETRQLSNFTPQHLASDVVVPQLVYCRKIVFGDALGIFCAGRINLDKSGLHGTNIELVTDTSTMLCPIRDQVAGVDVSLNLLPKTSKVPPGISHWVAPLVDACSQALAFAQQALSALFSNTRNPNPEPALTRWRGIIGRVNARPAIPARQSKLAAPDSPFPDANLVVGRFRKGKDLNDVDEKGRS